MERVPPIELTREVDIDEQNRAQDDDGVHHVRCTPAAAVLGALGRGQGLEREPFELSGVGAARTRLDVSRANGKSLTIRWMDIRGSAWAFDYKRIEADGDMLNVVTPTEEGYWAAVIKVN